MRDPENKRMWIRADGSTIRTSPYTVELLLGEDQRDPDFIDLDEETPLIALKIQYLKHGGAEIMASLQD
eukprot:10568512-Prorocentrum_lima.AAC.1